MMCFMDMVFCGYHEACSNGKNCPRAYTDKIKVEGRKWWGEDDFPINLFSSVPSCFVAINNQINDIN